MKTTEEKTEASAAEYWNLVATLTALRIQKGLSQYELAKRAGVAHTTIARIEALEYQPLLSTFLSIAHALGCTVSIQAQE